MPEELKRCTKCGQVKDQKLFSKDATKKDGLTCSCKECSHVSHKAYRESHPEIMQAYREVHREEISEYIKVYREVHREKCLEYGQVYRDAHREKESKYDKVYSKTHLVERATNNAKRRARQRQAAICDLTSKQWKAIKTLYGNKCAYCGKKPKRLTMDHVVPLAKGGNHTASNIVPACQSCNSRKNTRIAPIHQPHLLGALG